MLAPRTLAALLCVLAAAAPACKRRGRSSRRRVAAPPALFASPSAQTAPLREWLRRAPMLSTFVTAADGWAAAMEPAGRVRWAAAVRGAPAIRESQSPCRYDPSRHATYWALAPRIALDGRGYACCVHDGDNDAPSGAYCADLRLPAPRWRRARVPETPQGVGSGDGAIAIFARDLACTSDGGEHFFARFRGDLEQALSLGSCASDGHAVTMAGAHSFGALRTQTLRAGHVDGAVAMVPRTPRGEPIDARALRGGGFDALLMVDDGPSYVGRGADGAVTVMPLPMRGARATGRWGAGVVLATTGYVVARDGSARERVRRVDERDAAGVVAATRVGRELVGVTRDGQFLVLGRE